jgi:hypothetical protein
MACITIPAPPMAMATTQLMRETACELLAQVRSESNIERQSLRLNWVVVTGNNGSSLRAQWTIEAPRRKL